MPRAPEDLEEEQAIVMPLAARKSMFEKAKVDPKEVAAAVKRVNSSPEHGLAPQQQQEEEKEFGFTSQPAAPQPPAGGAFANSAAVVLIVVLLSEQTATDAEAEDEERKQR